MPRKKHPQPSRAQTEAHAAEAPAAHAAAATAEPPPASSHQAQGEGTPAGKNWGDPYRGIFVSTAKGFEMGENRRFKQRVFVFKEKPAEETLSALKDAGFTYRPDEKAWTIHADADTRRLSDELARRFAGQAPAKGALMQPADFFKQFADHQEIGRDVMDTQLLIFYDNGREVGLWRENRRTTEGAGEILGDDDAHMARYWYGPQRPQRDGTERSGWLDRTTAGRSDDRSR